MARPWTISFTEEALLQIAKLRAFDRATIRAQIGKKLAQAPDVETRSVKPLKGDPEGRWELRVGDWRVFYLMERSKIVVLVVAVVEKGRRLTVDVLRDGGHQDRYPQWFLDYLTEVQERSPRYSWDEAMDMLDHVR